jgi:hypothetical protein
MKTFIMLTSLISAGGCSFTTPYNSQIDIQVCILASCGGEGSTVTPHRQTDVNVPEPLFMPPPERPMPEPLELPEPDENAG